jgi:hypothetical protein
MFLNPPIGVTNVRSETVPLTVRLHNNQMQNVKAAQQLE